MTSIETNDQRITGVELADGRRLTPGHVVWSGNLKALAHLLGKEPPGIRYLSTVLFNMQIREPVLQDQQWIYYGGQDTVLSRVSITNEMASYMAPPGTSGLCVEVTCFEGNGAWEKPERLVDELKSDLVSLKLVADPSHFGDIHIEKVRDTYPIYDLRYKESFAEASRMVKSLENCKLLGRTGAYWLQQLGSFDEDGAPHGSTPSQRRADGREGSSLQGLTEDRHPLPCRACPRAVLAGTSSRQALRRRPGSRGADRCRGRPVGPPRGVHLLGVRARGLGSSLLDLAGQHDDRRRSRPVALEASMGLGAAYVSGFTRRGHRGPRAVPGDDGRALSNR